MREVFRARRAQLAADFHQIDSPNRLLELQISLVEEIKRVEAAAFRDRTSPEREHLKLMRLFGDGVAHLTLPTHTIRQLAKHPGKPPAISSQGGGFDFVLKCATLAAENGHAVRICDLTNVLRIGDLVIGHPDSPMLVECAPDGERQNARKQRQMNRMSAVAQVLRTGHGFIPGEPYPVHVHEVGAESEHSWAGVEQSCRDALRDGVGIAEADGDVIWAIGPHGFENGEVKNRREVEELTAGFALPLMATTSVLLEDPLPMIPPPLCYPMSLDLRIGLLERQIRLVHVIDVARFVGIEHDGARITALRRDRDGELMQPPFVLEADYGTVGAASMRFLDDVLYGFVTIESSAKMLLSGLNGMDDADGVDLGLHPPGVVEDLVQELQERMRGRDAA